MCAVEKSNKDAEARMMETMNLSTVPAIQEKITLAKHVTCLTTSHKSTSLIPLIQSAPSSGELLVKMLLNRFKQVRTVAA